MLHEMKDNWDVVASPNKANWIGLKKCRDGKTRRVIILPTTEPWELAVDAFLDFLDRMQRRRWQELGDEATMAECIAAARRQR